MIFKKPYAFFVKHFKLINLILTFLLGLLCVKVFNLKTVISDIYIGKITNYSSLNSLHAGFFMYLLVFLISVFLAIIIILLNKKKKPLKDYLFASIYIVALFIYLFSISNFFLSLSSNIIDQSTIKFYSDLSLIVVLPCLYFIFKFFLISIGFNLKKFDFTKDIIELKREEEDNEEVELIFDKNAYKYKRGLRRYLREFKYYLLENRFIFLIIIAVVLALSVSTIFGTVILKKDKVKLGKSFVAGNFSYVVHDVYETKYDFNHNLVKDGYKYVVADINVNNITNQLSAIDLKRIRLFFGDDYVYASNYYNKYFRDLGEPYNSQDLKPGESRKFLFIFQVPIGYKSRKYFLKFYDKNVFVDEELNAGYKTMNVKSSSLDKKYNVNVIKLNEKFSLGKDYGNTDFVINSFNKNTSFSYISNGESRIVVPENNNSILLILDYEINKDISNCIYCIKDENKFFSNFLKVSVKKNDKYNIVKSEIIKNDINNKIFISVPYSLLNESNIKIDLAMRNSKYSLIIN